MDTFVQEGPHLGNQLADDPLLVSLLRRLVPPDALDAALVNLGARGRRAAARAAATLPPAGGAGAQRRHEASSTHTPFLSRHHAERFGWEVATSVKELGQQAEREPPTLERLDSWGGRADRGALTPLCSCSFGAADTGLVQCSRQARVRPTVIPSPPQS